MPGARAIRRCKCNDAPMQIANCVNQIHSQGSLSPSEEGRPSRQINNKSVYVPMPSRQFVNAATPWSRQFVNGAPSSTFRFLSFQHDFTIARSARTVMRCNLGLGYIVYHGAPHGASGILYIYIYIYINMYHGGITVTVATAASAQLYVSWGHRNYSLILIAAK